MNWGSVVPVVVALLGIGSAVVTEYLAGRRQTRRDYQKEARLAVSQLTRSIGVAVHTIAWFTWKAKNRASLYTHLAEGGISPRQGRRHVAWGVSPRKERQKRIQSPGGATGARRTEETAVAPPGLSGIGGALLGLTPQATCLGSYGAQIQEARLVYKGLD